MTSADHIAACSERSVAEPAAHAASEAWLSEARLMAAEISRLRTKIVGLEAIVADNEARVANTHGMAAEIERLRVRIAELEAANDALAGAAIKRDADAAACSERSAAVTFGTLERPTPDEPTKIEHNILPSAPPHDE